MLSWLVPLLVSITIVVYQEVSQVGSVANFTTTRQCDVAEWLRVSCFYHFPTTVCGLGTLVFNLVTYSAMIYRITRQQQRIQSGRKNKSLLLRTVLMFLVFTASWLPAFVIIDIVERTGRCLTRWTAQVLLYLNTLTDPLIYILCPKLRNKCVRKGSSQDPLVVTRK